LSEDEKKKRKREEESIAIEAKLKKSKEDEDKKILKKTLSNSGEPLLPPTTPTTPVYTVNDDIANAKRKLSPQNEEQDKKKSKIEENKPLCQYGAKCYRKNPQHFREYSHPHTDV